MSEPTAPNVSMSERLQVRVYLVRQGDELAVSTEASDGCLGEAIADFLLPLGTLPRAPEAKPKRAKRKART